MGMSKLFSAVDSLQLLNDRFAIWDLMLRIWQFSMHSWVGASKVGPIEAVKGALGGAKHFLCSYNLTSQGGILSALCL